jgi:phosphoglycerate dehydrogenase-like enzyme
MIGFGSIARCLRPLLAPFGCPIAVYDPWLGAGYLRSQGVEPVALAHLLRTSQVIFVLASPSAESQALLSRELLEQIQPGAVLVLISCAHVIDFDALTDLVLAGRFKAAIDVFPLEPLPLDHPIRQAPGAILSAHRAGSVKEGLSQRLQLAQPELISRVATNRVPRPPT